MRPKPIPFARTATVLFFVAVAVSSVLAQNAAPAVTDGLRTQYKLVKLSEDSNGLAVIQPGTVLVIQQGGLLGIPPEKLVFCAAKFENGDLKAAAGFCAAMHKNVSRYFQKGDKVYPLKIDVNVKEEQISFKVVACDSCNGADPSFYKSEVVFQFSKGYLESAQSGGVQQAISQVFTLDAGDAQPAQGAQPATQAPARAPAAAPPPVAPPPPPTDQPPTTIAIGQTVDQVTAALGQPQRMAKFGAKQIYFIKT